MPANRRTCSLPECSAPADNVHSGHAYCACHRRELNAVRAIAARLLRTPKPPRVRVPAAHHDPRGDRRR